MLVVTITMKCWLECFIRNQLTGVTDTKFLDLSKLLINLKYCIFAYHHPHLASAGMLKLVKLWFSDLNFLYCQIATAEAQLQHKNYMGESAPWQEFRGGRSEHLLWRASALMVCTVCPMLLRVVHQILPAFHKCQLLQLSKLPLHMFISRQICFVAYSQLIIWRSFTIAQGGALLWQIICSAASASVKKILLLWCYLLTCCKDVRVGYIN